MSEEATAQVVEGQVEQALAVVPTKAPIRVGERGLAFENAAEVFRMAEAFVRGGVAPKGATPGGVMAAILKGRSLGLDEVTSLGSITVVNGRVQIGGALILALVRKHQACAELTYKWEGEGNTRAAIVRARRVEEREATEHRFGMDDAARAGLASKEAYRTWPDEMLLWRAVSRMGRRQFSDVLAGVYVAGEVVEATLAIEPSLAERRPAAPLRTADALLDELAPPPAADQPQAGPAALPTTPPPFESHAEADRAIAEGEGQGARIDDEA
jgi:hypothetical protein